MIDLKAKPFCLSQQECNWIKEVIKNMSDEEKIGQLFFGISSSFDEDYLKNLVTKYHLGGCRYNQAPAKTIRKHNEILQKYSQIPLFIACNSESGGNNACDDGTYIASGIKIGATGQKKYAYDLGKMANEQANAVGCNMAFAPVSDISYNWENTEIISRAFGNNPHLVEEMSCAYLEGAHTIDGFSCVAKHFPGNGMDFRDAHISNHVNSMDFENWFATYGKVYSTLFNHGLEAVMAGHIMLPKVVKSLNHTISDEQMMPATLSHEIMTELLRNILGFNGLVITDATHMVGMTCRMKREEMLPKAINAGCDMLLFFNDPDEDFLIMLNAYRHGMLSKERLNDSLMRILGLKVHMGLFNRQLVPSAKTMMYVLGQKRYLDTQREISEKSITLVKYKDKGILPLTPLKYKRIMLVHIKGTENGMSALIKALDEKKKSPVDLLKKKLTDKGFDVFIYENPLDNIKKQIERGEKADFNEFFAGKNAISDFKNQMDLVITVCDVASGRPSFGLSKGGGEIPWYVFEIPVIVIGCESPIMLADIPQARTYINMYDSNENTIDVLVEKLMKGETSFIGRDPIDSYCGLFDAYL
ncbi:MAG: glycoside hydrolase family 3 protein [Faecalibacillus sp.]